MVKARESWFNSQQQLLDLNCMSTLLEPGQPECLPPCANPGTYMLPTNVALPGFPAPGLATLRMEQTNGVHKLLQVLPPRFCTLAPDVYPNLIEKQSAFTCGFNGEARPNVVPGSSQKGFLVFDQSGNQTRLIYNRVCPSVLNPSVAVRKLVSGCGLQQEQAIKTDLFKPVKPIFHEECDENNVSGEESEMHEDTEEINALLYSDENSEDSDDDDDDEVKSTGHSPIATEGNYVKHKYYMLEISEEVASSDGPNKRQKLLDGRYRKSSQTDRAFSVKLEETRKYDNDAESSYANGETQREEAGSIMSNKRSRMDKIHKTLRILRSIIPGAKGKDPLSVFDEAIDYLQLLKLKAKALGV